MFKIFETKNDDYKCKLSTRALIECETILKQNPINVFISSAEGTMPKLGDLLIILWCSLHNENHGVKKEDIYDIYDSYCENGGSYLTLLDFITQLFYDSGIISKDKKEDEKKEDENKGEENQSPNA